MDTKTIFVRSFGCQMNDADSEVMENLPERKGAKKKDYPQGADVMILNKNN